MTDTLSAPEVRIARGGASWLKEDSRKFLSGDYLLPGVTPEARLSQIAYYAGDILGIPEFGPKLEDYLMRGWISLASPVWTNFGAGRGLPISCNNSYFEDTTLSILLKQAEIGMQTKYGAGTSAYLGAIRGEGSPISDGGVARGPMHFAQGIDTTIQIVSQGKIRRGNCAIYLPADHPDVMELLEAREHGHPIQNLSLGITFTDAWLEEMLAGNKRNRAIWARVLKKRFESGYPYILFHDTINRCAPEVYRDKGRTIWSSNLCTEVMCSSSHDESFVCDLSSPNIEKYDEWKDTDLVATVVYFLDAVLTDYIRLIEGNPLMETSRNFAVRQRAIGIGQLGWHAYLQNQMIPFGSLQAKFLGDKITKDIQDKSLAASQQMVRDGFEEPELLKGYGRRHVVLQAIAPTKSSSFILGTSPSIEPIDSNYHVKDLQKGGFTYRNPQLEIRLEDIGKNTPEVWSSILRKGGSVQHLEFLSPEERDVFRTFSEISQYDIVTHAASRQRYIDQAQSLNLKIHPDTPVKEVHDLIIAGWRMGIKSFYYQKGVNKAQELARSILDCSACEA